MTPDHVSEWVKRYPLEPIHVDCATAVMLKMLDGKCKMTEVEKIVMTLLYDQVKTAPGVLFGDAMHPLIAAARDEADDGLHKKGSVTNANQYHNQLSPTPFSPRTRQVASNMRLRLFDIMTAASTPP